MNYQEAIEYIHGTYKFGSKLGLENIKYLLNLLGNPQKELKVIHVAGTNGKGSTSSFINGVLKTSGYKVGLYTSPYIEEFTERMQINGEKIDKQRLAEVTTIVKAKIEQMLSEGKNHPTEFEVGTAIALVYFAEEKVDFTILEVGMGGRLDATNIIENPLLSIITPIDYDHMEHLGDTLEKIAFEKAGIIKENNFVVSYPQREEAKEVVKKVSREKNSQLFVVNYDHLKVHRSTIEEQQFSVEVLGKKYEDVIITLAGPHQVYNCCTALTAIEVLKNHRNILISDEAIYQGLKTTKWIGRLEVLAKNPLTIIDGAHNLQGATALKHSVETLLQGKKVTLVVAMLGDKDVQGVLSNLIPLMDKIVVTKPNNPRAMAADDLAKELVCYGKDMYICNTIKEAVKKAYEVTEASDVILFAGSLYMIGEARTILTNK
ncbi:bifunctional folylpolyglutamate synthase/dihydrofolate synthase [Clostridium formicaceticum]|uniref:Dihydrofolate synthase/folylpolyglutamate synthase n=1 Tax=Clostridium formicaceticum TaxID=1497 RepID=A0AAC9RKD4_9CLOT|nr:folylpolyglutamate synthase/dihydrofolate synthase family protein [Clostridium formicaceticum]AOY76209.1 bifunctional folylpolyglutamate synthase/dihydrofolate synthase [Clostridium formicaceticum]ARE86588.1 Folylpolyglutamate synthase [Clostridium formicaceticum]